MRGSLLSDRDTAAGLASEMVTTAKGSDLEERLNTS